MKELIKIHFDITVPEATLTPGSIELPDPKTKKELIRNYKIAKLLAEGKKIEIIIEEKCPCCKEITERRISLKELKKYFDIFRREVKKN